MMRWLSNTSPYSFCIFAYVMVLMLGISTVVWEENINDKLYHCTDAVGLDFLQPGNWVHGNFEYVSQIDVHRSMSLPDEVKEGWSVAGLWALWFGFVGVSVMAGVLVASIPWILKRTFAMCRPVRAQ